MNFKRIITFFLLLSFAFNFTEGIFFPFKNFIIFESIEINEDLLEDEKYEDESDEFLTFKEIMPIAIIFDKFLNFIPYIENPLRIKFSLEMERPPEA